MELILNKALTFFSYVTTLKSIIYSRFVTNGFILNTHWINTFTSLIKKEIENDNFSSTEAFFWNFKNFKIKVIITFFQYKFALIF